MDGIPVLLSEKKHVDHDELEHGLTHHKRQQSAHFDRDETGEFEIVRPLNSPAFYAWLLRERFRRATQSIGTDFSGYTVATVCGGSGMDAHFFAEAGASVTSVDISLGAAKRALARSERFGLDITSIVADVEQLPLDNASVDLVYVHDGLHHLERPEVGIVEMARVARRWVSVTEPARAAATSCAVRLGLALEREEAGNPVARLRPSDVVETLKNAGFQALHAERYAMYYQHRPGRVFEMLSRRPLFPVLVVVWRMVNAIFGRFGNKLAVIAARPPVG